MKSESLGWSGLVAAVIAVGCGEPSLSISISVDTSYLDRIDRLELSVIVPPESIEGCDSLAYGEVTTEVIATATADSVTIGVEELERTDSMIRLTEIPRKGRKLLYLDARDGEDLVVVAGCTEIETISDDESTVISTEPATEIRINALNPLGGVEMPETIDGRVTEIAADPSDDDRPLANLELKWQVVGPGGDGGSGTVTSLQGGRFVLTPTVSAAPGPSVLIVRTKWSRSGAPPRFVTFKKPPTLAEENFGITDSGASRLADPTYVIGTIGANGEHGFATLVVETVDQWRVRTYLWNGSTLVLQSISDPIASIRTLGLASRGARQQVVAFVGENVTTPDGWLEVNPTTGAIVEQPPPFPLGPSEVVERLLPAGPCSSELDATQTIFVQTAHNGASGDTINRRATVDANGALLDGPTDITDGSTITASGCAASTDGEILRTLVSSGNDRAFVAAVVDGEPRPGANPFSFGPTGFSSAVMDETERLLTSELTLGGTVIAKNRISVRPNDIVLEAQTAIPTLSAPFAVAGGNLDGDGLTDIVALLPVGNQRVRTFVSLGVTLDDEPVGGISRELEDTVLEDPTIQLYDFDDDGDEDIFVGARTGYLLLEAGEP